jgi:hypothetical protein
MILASFGQVGGIEYLKQQSIDNPTAYMTLLGKAIPKEVAVEIERNAWEMIDHVESGVTIDNDTQEAIGYVDGDAAKAEV